MTLSYKQKYEEKKKITKKKKLGSIFFASCGINKIEFRDRNFKIFCNGKSTLACKVNQNKPKNIGINNKFAQGPYKNSKLD